MRENIGLFRGKRSNGEWITGSLLKVTLAEKTAYLIFEDKFTFTLGAVNALSHAAVDPETIGECTGLRDKNGKLIFEGDIICTDKGTEYEAIGKVSMEWKSCCALLFRDSEWDFLATNTKTGEIVGNIHDNPELLKEGACDG